MHRERSLFYLARPAAGGIKEHLQILYRNFINQYRLYLATGIGGDSLSVDCADAILLPLRGHLDPAGDWLSFWSLYRLLKQLRPGLLHIHGFKAALIGLPAARLTGVPALVTVHNFLSLNVRRVAAQMHRIAGGHETRYIAVSHSLARELKSWGIPAGRISVIYNGIDPAPYRQASQGRRPPEGGRILVGTAARLAPQKGLPVFIRAAAILADRFPRMQFLIAGSGPERPALEDLARRLGLSGRLSFPGYCKQLPDTLARIDIFVLPSLSEGQSITLLQAMAAGCTAVASRIGGVPEVIEDGLTGRLVPPGNAEALASVIAELAGDPEQARRLAAAGEKRVAARFTVQQMLAQTAAIYELCLGGRHPAREKGGG